MAKPIYVIPDIHGQKAKLDHALSLIRAEGGKHARIVFLGDYVDRGPDTCAVLQTLVDGLDKGCDWTLLRGNHDQLMLDALSALPDCPPAERQQIRWLSYKSGAAETLASYGVSPEDPARTILRAISPAHIDVLKATKLWYHTKGLGL